MSVAIDQGLSDFQSGYVVADVSFTHPFLGVDTFTGFDVRGVCIGDGSIDGVNDAGILYAGPDDLCVLNADGYTRWFNQVEFTAYGTIFGFTLGKLGVPTYDLTATLNGYKYYCDGLDNEDDVAGFFGDPSCANPRGLFSAGNTLTRRFELQFPVAGGTPKFVFQYAVAASWEPPEPNPPEDVPDDFSLSANCHEAYALSVDDQSTLYYVDSGTKGGEMVLDIVVYDHQGVQNPGGVNGEIARIHVETSDPLINGNIATFEPDDLASSLVSNDQNAAHYLLVVPETDLNPFASGDFDAMLAVESADPSSYDQGFSGFAFPDGALAAYFRTTVHVGDMNPNEKPVAIADTETGTYQAFKSVPFGFDGSDSYDPDGVIVSYEWDSDEDGQYDDASGPTPEIVFDTEGVFDVDLKVTDDDGAWDTLDDPIQITVLDKVIHVDDDNTTPPWYGTEQDPFQYIPDGVDAVPDDTGWMVYVHEGNYTNALYYSDSGNPNSPGGMIWMDSTQNVIVKGEDGARINPPTNYTTGKGVFRIVAGCSDITIDNFEFKNTYAYQSAIWAENVPGLTVRDCEIVEPAASYGYLEFLRTSSCSDVLAKDNTFDSFNSASTFMSVFVISGGSDITITGNDVYNLNNWVGYNIYQTGEGYIAVYNASDVEISKNKLGGDHHRSADSSNYVQQAIVDINGGSNITIRNNLIYDTYFQDSGAGASRNWGIRVSSGASGVEIYQNTMDLVGPASSPSGTGYTYGIWLESGSVSTCHSNIISNTQAPQSATCYGVYAASAMQQTYSDVWGVVGGTTGLYGGSAVEGVGGISADPEYEDPDNFDYHLATGSPCIGTGLDGEDMGCYGGSDPLE
jgi:hypothetical protein